MIGTQVRAFPPNRDGTAVGWGTLAELLVRANSERRPHRGWRRWSEGKAAADGWSDVVVGVIGDAGAVGNGDAQSAGHVGICHAGK